MRNVILALACVFVTSSASAQTVDRQIDLSSLNWGDVTVRPVDTDGKAGSEEWVVQRTIADVYGSVTAFRVVAVRNGRACWGEWFTPESPDRSPFVTVQFAIIRDGQTDKLMQTTRTGVSLFGYTPPVPTHIVTLIRLDTPGC